jgi:hypothetical protein
MPQASVTIGCSRRGRSSANDCGRQRNTAHRDLTQRLEDRCSPASKRKRVRSRIARSLTQIPTGVVRLPSARCTRLRVAACPRGQPANHEDGGISPARCHSRQASTPAQRNGSRASTLQGSTSNTNPIVRPREYDARSQKNCLPLSTRGAGQFSSSSAGRFARVFICGPFTLLRADLSR